MFFVLSKFYFNSKCTFFYYTNILDIKQKDPSFHDEYTRHKHRKDLQ